MMSKTIDAEKGGRGAFRPPHLGLDRLEGFRFQVINLHIRFLNILGYSVRKCIYRLYDFQYIYILPEVKHPPLGWPHSSLTISFSWVMHGWDQAGRGESRSGPALRPRAAARRLRAAPCAPVDLDSASRATRSSGVAGGRCAGIGAASRQGAGTPGSGRRRHRVRLTPHGT